MSASRPGRFGKSYAANMLEACYDCSCDSHEFFLDAVTGVLLPRGEDEDLSGQTVYNEGCVLLEKMSNRKADAKIRIDVDPEDYYKIKDKKQRTE